MYKGVILYDSQEVVYLKKNNYGQFSVVCFDYTYKYPVSDKVWMWSGIAQPDEHTPMSAKTRAMQLDLYIKKAKAYTLEYECTSEEPRKNILGELGLNRTNVRFLENEISNYPTSSCYRYLNTIAVNSVNGVKPTKELSTILNNVE